MCEDPPIQLQCVRRDDRKEIVRDIALDETALIHPVGAGDRVFNVLQVGDTLSGSALACVNVNLVAQHACKCSQTWQMIRLQACSVHSESHHAVNDVGAAREVSRANEAPVARLFNDELLYG